ncbi:MAG: DUF5682 family protein [Pseudomonadota bacterium]
MIDNRWAQPDDAADDLSLRVRALYRDPSITYIPIRHHSPACALHLVRLIDEERPDSILIEGPSEANAYLDALQDPETTPPVAIYLFAEPPVSMPDADPVRCFAPLAAMSPEWVALREANRINARTEFIDLPFGEQVTYRNVSTLAPTAYERLFRGDEALLQNTPIDQLVATSGLRDFDAWWDHHVEARRAPRSPCAFFHNIHMFSAYLRLLHPCVDEETRAREAHMATRVAEARQRGERCFVITGGFHPLGIAEALDDAATTSPPVTRRKATAYLVPYSLARLNRASGYASGMPDIGYYDAMWHAFTAKREKSPHITVARRFAIALAKQRHNATLPASLVDAIEALTISERLADLRGIHLDRVAFRDGALSAFAKSDDHAINAALDHLLEGDRIGRVPPTLPRAPLVEDFRSQCKRFRISLSARASGPKHLDIYRSERHRAISHFFHRLAFLGVPFAEAIAGPDFATASDLDLVHERWQHHWRVDTEPALTELSHLGATLFDVCTAHAITISRDAQDIAVGAALVLRCLQMGLHKTLPDIAAYLDDQLARESDPVPLAGAFTTLLPAYFAHRSIGALQNACIERLLSEFAHRFLDRLHWLTDLPPEYEKKVCEALIALFGLTRQAPDWLSENVLLANAATVTETLQMRRSHGVMCAILMLAEHHQLVDTRRCLSSAFGAAEVDPTGISEFLSGFLSLGKARLLQEPTLIEQISQGIERFDEDEFLSALPALRLAFSSLTPGETRALARMIGVPPIDTPLAMSSDLLVQAKTLRDELNSTASAWGLPS